MRNVNVKSFNLFFPVKVEKGFEKKILQEKLACFQPN